MTIKSALRDYQLQNKKIFLRVDLNVPLRDGTIMNDYRLKAITPTLDFCVTHGAIVILATHIGRPQKASPDLSTKNLIPWFEKNGYALLFEPNFEALSSKQYAPGTIILLENLRFYAGEKSGDAQFARALAAIADYYVNDAFATLHRTDASVVLVPEYFAHNHKTIGFLIEKELNVLAQLMHAPKLPYVLVLGGGKVSDKIPILQNLLQSVSTVLLCPAIVFTFLKSLGKPVGKSLVDDHALIMCKELLAAAKRHNVRIVFPLDYQVTRDSSNAQLMCVDADHIPADALGVSIGPKTIAAWSPIIHDAKTIFYNAAMGFSDQPSTWQNAQTLLRVIAESPAFTVIGGGDSVTMAQGLEPKYHFSFFSTGGGATLAALSGTPLPGLRALGIMPPN